MNDLHRRIAASFGAQGLMATLGAELALVEDGEVHIVLPYSAHLSQQHGYLHAGAVTSIVDSACGYAALTKAPPDCEVVTAEFKINLMRPALGHHFLAIGRVQSAGRLLTVCTGEVRAFAGVGGPHKVVALMQATIVSVRPLRPARPPGTYHPFSSTPRSPHRGARHDRICSETHRWRAGASFEGHEADQEVALLVHLVRA